jgi:hypothetical protein
MAIRLNLLAEAQAAEDMRRRDPVKRAIWVAALAISVMLVWSSSVQLKAIMANRDLNHIENQMNDHTNEYKHVLDNQKRIEEFKRKTAALNQLAGSRFLHGSLLNALQQTNVDSVHLVRLRTEQSYVFVEEVKGRTNDNKFIPGRPATATERAILTLDANDSSANPGDQVNKFKEAIGGVPYIRELLGKTNVVNLKNLSQPTFSQVPGPSAGKASVLFTLESRFPEKTR